jgi:HEAT repeat protein
MRSYAAPDPLVDVLEEYLEEAAYLFRARTQCLSDPALSWQDLPAREVRLAAQLDGLVVGGRASAQLLKDVLVQDEDGDPGEMFAAAAVIPSLGLVEPLEWLRDAIAAAPPLGGALIEGLRFSTSPELVPWLFDFVKHESAAVRAAGAELLGARGVESAIGVLSELAGDPEPRAAVAAQIALARLGRPPVRERLLAAIGAKDLDVAYRAAAELLAQGEARAIDRVRARCASGSAEERRRLLPLLAVAGAARDVVLFRHTLRDEPDLADVALFALGVCGSPEGIADLIEFVGRPEDAAAFAAAHQALRTLSGLDALPGFDRDQATPERVQAYQELWRGWWNEARAGFAPDLRWRRGAPLWPPVLAEDLTRAGNPRRDLSYLELQLRYACPVPFDPWGPYAAQAAQLTQIRDWAARAGASFEPGRTYVYGNPAA